MKKMLVMLLVVVAILIAPTLVYAQEDAENLSALGSQVERYNLVGIWYALVANRNWIELNSDGTGRFFHEALSIDASLIWYFTEDGYLEYSVEGGIIQIFYVIYDGKTLQLWRNPARPGRFLHPSFAGRRQQGWAFPIDWYSYFFR